MKQPYISNKWKKTAVLAGDHTLAQYIPPSGRLNGNNLFRMLSQYRMVYVKPVHGKFGRGVMKVRRTLNRYTYRYGTKTQKFASYAKMLASLKKKTGRKPYMIQKGIHLLRYQNRLFDIRLMVQKNPKRKWEVTGIIGRLAKKGSVVTNYHSGGTPMSVHVLLAPHLSKSHREAFVRKLSGIGLKAAHQYQKKSKRFNELGVDFGTDGTFHPWILEVNLSPDPYIFQKLKDKSVFRKVYRYAKAYGKI